ncbi:MAG: SDR family NAD(P)-dependent oxidoreductase [Brevundimonas sp.]|uniref:SDR family NAD(P)-dependent oxidoreductase n=1 Tax=Brevundimonas sp. TaxID=1871086 RepID=UPI002735E12E|nr:SDR family NAD(P)-dependent oxidoreductase [Brevundimonas sp.]MDP3404103.1 SDR family NAD(P)-dependent oxidoreductase [Brevundimonas sp.]
MSTSVPRAKADFRTRYGPWAAVTGATSGIGEAFALDLARRGLDLVLVARNAEALATLAASPALAGRQTRVIAADLSTLEGIEAVRRATADLEVGLLVAAAGFGTSGLFLDADAATEREMVQVNCLAVLDLCRHFAPAMARRGRGGLVLMSSLVGRQGTPYAVSYAASKAWVHVLAEGLNAELKSSGVDVIACAPGPVRSGFAERAGLRMGLADRPRDVARPTLSALGRKRLIAPGPVSKLLTWSLATAPRPLRGRILGGVMRGMAKGPGRP